MTLAVVTPTSTWYLVLAAVLFSLLLFSGTGSLLSDRLAGEPLALLSRVLVGILVLSLAYVPGVPLAIRDFLGAPIGLRIGIVVALLAPIGLLLNRGAEYYSSAHQCRYEPKNGLA